MASMTRQLWRALQSPPHHAVETLPPSSSENTTRRISRKLIFGILSVALGLFIVALIVIPPRDLLVGLSSSLAIGLFSIVGLILLSGTINGAIWTFQVATVMYRDLQEGRYDLLSLSPLGVLGALWMITRQDSRASRVVEFFDYLVIVLFFTMIFTGSMFIYTLVQGPPTIFLSQPLIGSLLTVGFFVLVFYLDYVQAQVIGHLCGIFLASMMDSESNAEVASVTVLVLIQFGAYLIAGLIAFLGAIISQFIFRDGSDASLLLIAVLFVGAIYAFREVTIRILWRSILMQFAVTHSEYREFLSK